MRRRTRTSDATPMQIIARPSVAGIFAAEVAEYGGESPEAAVAKKSA